MIDTINFSDSIIQEQILAIGLTGRYIELYTTQNLQSGKLATLPYTIQVEQSLYKKILIVWLGVIVFGLIVLAYGRYQSKILAFFTTGIFATPFYFSDKAPLPRHILVLVVAVFVLGFLLRWYHIAHKDMVHHADEVWTIAITSVSKGCLWNGECKDGVYFGKEIKQREFWYDPSISGALSDIKELYLTNNGDSASHTNLYYTLLRLWHIGVQTGDMGWIIQRGAGFNLLLVYPLSFLFAFLLGARLLGRGLALVVFLALAFLNASGIFMTLFIREYALQGCLFLAFSWVLVRFYTAKSITYKDILLTAFISALFLLSGYFTLLFVLASFALFLPLALGQHPTKAKALAGTGILSIGVVYMLYPIYHRGFFGHHADWALEKGGNGTLENLIHSFEAYGKILVGTITTPMLLAVVLIALVLSWKFVDRAYYKSREALLVGLLSGMGLVFGLVVMYLAPWKVGRFVVASLPLLCLGISAALVPLLQSNYKKSALLVSLALIISLYIGYDRSYARATEVSLDSTFQPPKVRSDRAVPTIYNVNSAQMSAHIISQLDDVRLYYFIMDPKQALESAKSFRECYLLTMLDESAVRAYFGDQFEVATITTFFYNMHPVYYIKKNHSHNGAWGK